MKKIGLRTRVGIGLAIKKEKSERAMTNYVIWTNNMAINTYLNTFWIVIFSSEDIRLFYNIDTPTKNAGLFKCKPIWYIDLWGASLQQVMKDNSSSNPHKKLSKLYCWKSVVGKSVVKHQLLKKGCLKSVVE